MSSSGNVVDAEFALDCFKAVERRYRWLEVAVRDVLAVRQGGDGSELDDALGRLARTLDACAELQPGDPVEDGRMSEQTYTYREELFGASEDGPFWVAAENPDGSPRTEAQALGMVDDFMGPADEPWVAAPVQGRISTTEHGLRFDKDPAGPLSFWEVDVP